MVQKLSAALLFCAMNAFGQISPPGLDDTHMGFWSAIAFNQKLSPRWDVTIYLGESRESDPDNFTFFKKQALYVFNEETRLHFNERFSLAFCASYRIQNRYMARPPYGPANPEIRNEERYYLRFYFREKIGKAKLTFSIRPELRLYASANHSRWKPVDEELRFRVKGQISVPFRTPANQLIIANEILSATDHENRQGDAHWTAYAFTEDRLTLFFRHTFQNVITDVGLMHQIKGDGNAIVHLALDLILTNPLTRKR